MSTCRHRSMRCAGGPPAGQAAALRRSAMGRRRHTGRPRAAEVENATTRPALHPAAPGAAFAGAIIPLWSEGTIWWDIRDANFCWDQAARRLTLIDTDSLAAYADEIQQRPAVWQRREKGPRGAGAAPADDPAAGRGSRLPGQDASQAGRPGRLGERAGAAPAAALGRDPARRAEQQQAALAALRRLLEEVDRKPSLPPRFSP